MTFSLRSAILLSLSFSLSFSARAEIAQEPRLSADGAVERTVTLYDSVPASILVAESQAKGDEIPFDGDRAARGLYFLLNHDRIVAKVTWEAARSLEYLEGLESRHGAKAMEDWRATNHGMLTLYEFADGSEATGEELSKPGLLEKEIEKRGPLRYKAEPTMIPVENPPRKEMILKVVDYSLNTTFEFVDPRRVPLDSPLLQKYTLRQVYLAGKSSERQGRDVVRIAVSFDALDNGPLQEKRFEQRPLLSREGVRERLVAYDEPIRWPQSVIGAVWSTMFGVGAARLSEALVRIVYPNTEVNSLMTYLTVAFGMGIGLKSPFFTNLEDSGNTLFERVIRRSVLGVTFAVTYRVAHDGGFSHLGLIDTAQLMQAVHHGASYLSVIDLTGLTNWALLLGNVALAKFGSDPINDFNGMRRDMRLTTMQVVFAPYSEVAASGEGEPMTLKVGGKRVVIPCVRVTRDHLYFGVPGLKKAWDSGMKWHVFERPLVKLAGSFSKLFDQIMMGVTAGAALSGEHAMAETLGMALLAKTALLMQIPSGRRFVLWYAEKHGHEDAGKLRASWDASFFGWVGRMSGRLSALASRWTEKARSWSPRSCLRLLERSPPSRSDAGTGPR